MSENPPTSRPAARDRPRHILIFLSSPGDVGEERRLARQLIKDRLPVDPFLRGRATFDAVSWDDPDAGTPMLGTLTPQDCVDRFGAKPSACDIVVVMLWSRMGTPLPDNYRKANGERFLSGTEWEFEDAINGDPAPDLLVYRRDETPKIDIDDPDLPAKQQQYRLVKQFFDGFRHPDGSLVRSFTPYGKPEDFVRRLGDDLRQLLRLALDKDDAKAELLRRVDELEGQLAEKDRLIGELNAAVEAVAAEAKQPQQEETVEAALRTLATGDATEAKAVLAGIVERKAAEGSRALAEAAAAARHLGTLAMLDDTLEALRAFRRAADLDPADTWTWIHISRLEVQRGDLAAAGTAARRARQAAEQTNDARDIAVADNELGDVLVAQGKLGDALAAYAASRAICERLAAADPANAGWQRDLSVSHNKVGDVLVAQGKLGDALAAYAASRAICARLAAADPANAGWQRDLSVSHDKVGDVLVAQGKLGDALAAYAASRAICERLAAADPANAGWQRDLSVSHDKVGDVLVAQGKLGDALAAYAASRAIRERLAAADPANAGWQRDLFVSYAKLGSAEAGMGNPAAAEQWYRKAEPIVRRLVSLDATNATWRQDLDWLEDRLREVPTEAG
ncbi:MAG: hypothetical protein U1E66_13680 [Rhodospirillales bacterium]